jgi:hypothetical protein
MSTDFAFVVIDHDEWDPDRTYRGVLVTYARLGHRPTRARLWPARIAGRAADGDHGPANCSPAIPVGLYRDGHVTSDQYAEHGGDSATQRTIPAPTYVWSRRMWRVAR